MKRCKRICNGASNAFVYPKCKNHPFPLRRKWVVSYLLGFPHTGENRRETKKPLLKNWKNPNFRSGEWKKKPQDSGRNPDEGFDYQ